MSTAEGLGPSPAPEPQAPRRLWVFLLARALPAVVIALVITFTQHHPVEFGFGVFGAYALVSGVLIGVEAFGVPGHPGRVPTALRGALTVVAGAVAIVVAAVPGLATAAGLILLLSLWAGSTGLLELLGAWLLRRSSEARIETGSPRASGPRSLLARQAAIAGSIALLLALLVATVPPELRLEYGGREQIEGALTAPMQAIGYFGAYAALLGVLLIIEGLTLRALSRAQDGSRQQNPAARTLAVSGPTAEAAR